MNPENRKSQTLDPLPIDPHLPKIIDVLHESGALVLTAPPGAGKTTRVPRALHDAGFSGKGEILILEPRRIAARLAASRVAQELGEKPGQTVGYSIRFENVAGPKTRIRFLTEAILARRFVHDPKLQDVSAVILDEFHERHLATDLSLAFLKQLQTENPRIKILVMSATMESEPVISFLKDAQRMSIAGSPYDLSIEYEERINTRPLHEKVAAAVSKLLRSGLHGNILIFLPGSSEIRRAAEALEPIVERSKFQLSLLHGDLPLSEQRRAIESAALNKVILATNVAETSITIPGTAAVIDSGLVRVAGHSAWSGFPTLSTAKISKSSATQRAGRAGRTQAGRVIRLYTKSDYESRPEHKTPEIKRADLAEALLMLHAAGVHDIGTFPWFDLPPAPAIEAADTLLAKLGAIKETGQLSEIGMRMLELPMHPRLARLIIEGEKLNAVKECTLLAALLSERDIRLDARADFSGFKSQMSKHSGPSDLLELLDRFREAEEADFNPERLCSVGLDVRTVHSVRRGQRQIRRILSKGKTKRPSRLTPAQIEEAVLIATLAAFPDRVGKRRKMGTREILLAGGGSAVLSPKSVVHNSMFVVAIDAEERKEKNSPKTSGIRVRLASAIEIEWLAALFPEMISQKNELIWNERAGRVDFIQRTDYGKISLEEKVKPASPSKEAARILVSEAFSHGALPFHDSSRLPAFQARLELVSSLFTEYNWPVFDNKEVHNLAAMLCEGKCSLKELEPLSLIRVFMDELTQKQRDLLEREAPERIRLKSGRSVKIHYESAKPPWIESRLQDFFGTDRTPSVCNGQVLLTIHLLAPNGRAVQVTQDLSGFWKKHYPAVRRELQRRYPRHAWPELASLTKG